MTFPRALKSFQSFVDWNAANIYTVMYTVLTVFSTGWMMTVGITIKSFSWSLKWQAAAVFIVLFLWMMNAVKSKLITKFRHSSGNLNKDKFRKMDDLCKERNIDHQPIGNQWDGGEIRFLYLEDMIEAKLRA